MINFTNNKKLNIKINILLAAFLEDEFHDNEICINENEKYYDVKNVIDAAIKK